MSAIGLGMPGLRRTPPGPPGTADRPATSALVDRFGRTARDLRISVTTACSLRCTYCMPEQGLPVVPTGRLLTADEIARLVRIAVDELGVVDVRFTGGEPLLRPDLVDIIAQSARVAGTASISLTTNGIGLERRIDALRDAGLTRVNISLDTVDRDHFARLTRRDRLPAVLRGIEGARRAGLTPLKINAVLMRDTLAGAADLVAWALEHRVELRFIEQMPLDADEAWVRENMVDAAELVTALAPRFALSDPHRDDPHAPAESWLVDGGPARVGIIASVTRSFCSACDRTRLTAEGTVRSCLFGDDEVDLRGRLRAGADDAELADLWRAAMWGKQAGHGMEREGFRRPIRTMGAIGG
ncbi:GTP 3',8-cyclase MoaA [Microcella daejeonensis]|uniref:GTP 3',8-cyclase MoaA n=1 Tax=Microcella daejeonensis TaxID=2994971 RepID=UPI00226FE615|nr:GTP 3',8-cyclase MoaA [Microcella daejeonensis]WAB83963.1 GTP 3',8-cyclase MoaA [Microcella daejeonensis]